MDNAGSLPAEKTLTYNYTNTADNNKVKSASKKIKVPGSGNQGFAKRHQFIRDGKLLTMEGPLFVDAFMSNRLLLDKVDIKLILNRSADQFCLIDKNQNPLNAKVKLTDVILKVRKVRASQAVQAAHTATLKCMPAIYPHRRVECKAFVVPGNVPSIRKDNIFTGTLPKTFVFAFADATAYIGSYGKNRFNFKNYGVTSVTLTANGEELPFKQFNLNYENKKENFTQAFGTLFSGTGKMNYNTHPKKITQRGTPSMLLI